MKKNLYFVQTHYRKCTHFINMYLMKYRLFLCLTNIFVDPLINLNNLKALFSLQSKQFLRLSSKRPKL